MTTIIHRTNGLIDIQAFTIMGMSAKPHSKSPIGRFGTGLKYAVAVLVRAGAKVTLWIGQDSYEFYGKSSNFRGTEFQRIRMKRKKFNVLKPSHHDLPFTTEYGKDWQMWMAFRELEANTRDEDGGQTHCIADSDDVSEYVDRWHTCLVIEGCEEYSLAYERRDQTFLPGAASVLNGVQIQVLPGASKHLYYRGMRAKDLAKPSLFTYNILATVGLTEDRQLASEWEVRNHLVDAVVTSQDPDFIRYVLLAKDATWEHGMDFNSWAKSPSDVFNDVMAGCRKKTWPSAARYYDGYHPTPTRVQERIPNQFDLHPGPWEIDGDYLLDKNSVVLFVKPDDYEGDWESLIDVMLKRLNRHGGPVKSPEVDFNAPAPTLSETRAPLVLPAASSFDIEEIPF